MKYMTLEELRFRESYRRVPPILMLKPPSRAISSFGTSITGAIGWLSFASIK